MTDPISNERSALPAPDGLVERLLEAADDWRRLSDPENEELTLSAATAIQSTDEQIERWRQNSIDTWSAVFAEIERLTRERDVALENYTRAWNERDAQRRRAVAAEQQVQKLTAENERLKEALVECKEALVAAEDRDNHARFRANSPREDAEVTHLRTSAIRRARSALETQEDGE